MEPDTRKRLQAELQSLRPVLPSEPNHRFLDLFDQFMEQREYELALHTVCDYILEPGSPRVGVATVTQIDRLHALMKIDDQCVQELRSLKLA
jgi:hypothetical protein